MAFQKGSETKAILAHAQELTVALSNKPLAMAEVLVDREFISNDVLAQMLVHKTAEGKAAILVEAVRESIETAPETFEKFIRILLESSSTKDVAERLSSTKQSKLRIASIH